MRAIGQGEKALDLMVTRGLTREAFGKPLVQLGGNIEIISRARIEIEAMRLMVLKAAKAMDVLGNQQARIWIHMVKAMVPIRVCEIIDQAIQMHGALGISQKTPLANMYTNARAAPRRRAGRGPPHGGRPQRAAAALRNAGGRVVDRGSSGTSRVIHQKGPPFPKSQRAGALGTLGAPVAHPARSFNHLVGEATFTGSQGRCHSSLRRRGPFRRRPRFR
jgi:hypothetical protein